MFGKVNILSAIDASYRRNIIELNELVDSKEARFEQDH